MPGPPIDVVMKDSHDCGWGGGGGGGGNARSPNRLMKDS